MFESKATKDGVSVALENRNSIKFLNERICSLEGRVFKLETTLKGFPKEDYPGVFISRLERFQELFPKLLKFLKLEYKYCECHGNEKPCGAGSLVKKRGSK